MVSLKPVSENPFEPRAPRLTPVDRDPFATGSAAPAFDPPRADRADGAGAKLPAQESAQETRPFRSGVGGRPEPTRAYTGVPRAAAQPSTDVLGNIYTQYPRLKGPDWQIVDSRGKEGATGQLEFYPPDERYNPRPGKPTIELFNPELQGDSLQRAVFGDMLHYAPTIDPEFAEMRRQFAATITPEQRAIDQRAYERGKAEYGENRPYDDWFEISRLDAYLRGYLAPDERNEWANAYTPEQRALLERMKVHLQGSPQTFGQNVAEFVKAAPGGAVSTVGTSITGIGANMQAGRQQAQPFHDALLNAPTMTPAQRSQWRKRAFAELPKNVAETFARGLSDIEAGDDPREVAPMVFPPVSAPTTAENPVVQAGQAVTEYGRTLFPAEPGYEESIGRQLGQGVGSVAAGVGTSMLTGPAGAATLFAFAGSGEAVERAMQAGASEEDIVAAAKAGLLPGMTDSVPVETLLGRIPVPGGKFIQVPANMLGQAIRAVGRIGWQAFVEGVQEGGQAFLQNLIAQQIYAPEQSLTEGVVPEGGLGAGVGGLTEAARLAVTNFGGRRSASPAPVAAPPAEAPAQTFGQADMPAFDTGPAVPEGYQAIPETPLVPAVPETMSNITTPVSETPQAVDSAVPNIIGPSGEEAVGADDVSRETRPPGVPTRDDLEAALEGDRTASEIAQERAETPIIVPVSDTGRVAVVDGEGNIVAQFPEQAEAQMFIDQGMPTEDIESPAAPVTPGAVEQAGESAGAGPIVQPAPVASPATDEVKRYILDTKKPLNPKAMMRDIEASESDIRQALNALVNEGYARHNPKTDRYARTPKRGPLDVLAFISSKGGIRDDEGHDLRKSRDGQRFIPGIGPVIRAESGMSLDAMGEMLWQEGYFGPPGMTARPDVPAVLELLDRAWNGEKVYSENDRAEIEAQQAQAVEEENARVLEDARAEVADVATEVGAALEDREREEIAIRVAQGESAIDILGDMAERQALQYKDEIGGDSEQQTNAATGTGERVAPAGESIPPFPGTEDARPADRGDVGENPPLPPAQDEGSRSEQGVAPEPVAEPEAAPPQEQPTPDTTRPTRTGERDGEAAAEAYTLRDHAEISRRIREGEIDLAAFKAAWGRFVANEDNLRAELSKWTKKRLLPLAGVRYRNDRKDTVVGAALHRLEMDFFVTGDAFTWSPLTETMTEAMARHVAETTQADLDAKAGKQKEAAPAKPETPAQEASPSADPAPDEQAARPAPEPASEESTDVDAEEAPAETQPPAELPQGNDEILAQHGIRIEKSESRTGKEVWNVTGAPRKVGDYIMANKKKLGASWYRKDKAWSFWNGDPTETIVALLEGRDPAEPGKALAADKPGAGANPLEDRERAKRREREDARADERTGGNDAASLVSKGTADLIRGGAEFGIPQDIIGEQIEDIGRLKAAYTAGKPMFLLANAAGTGKTFVLGGAIRELKAADAPPIVYVTQSQDLIRQIKQDLAPYGVEGVRFETYKSLKKIPMSDVAGAVLMFDEAHNIKNTESQQGERAAALIAGAKFTVFASATPYENPVQAAYLEPTGVFADVGGHHEWAKMYGAAVRTWKEYDRSTGQTVEREAVYWVGGKSKQKDAAAARAWIDKQGLMTQRAMKIDPSMVDVNGRKVDVKQEFVDIYDRVTAAYDEAMNAYLDESGNSRDSLITAQIAMHRENLVKRILEASKAEAAIGRAKELLDDNKNVVIFVETKSDRDIGRFRRSAHFKDKTLYTYPEMQRLMEEWKISADMAAAMKERPPPKPFADFIYEIARHFHDAGVSYELPSTANDIRDALKSYGVGIYTGAVTEAKASKAKQDFLAGDLRVLIATMAKGGTGLSLHDKVGDRPTVQLNLNLPWSATKVDQVAARVARYGLKSRAQVEWIFAGNIPWERDKLAPRVAGRMRDMGAVVKGMNVNMADALDARFDFEGTVDLKGMSTIDVDEEADGDIYEQAQRLENTRRKASDTSGGFFATPYPISALMTKVSGVETGDRVLEPSAGTGNLVKFVPGEATVDLVEQRADNWNTLKALASRNEGWTAHNADFLEWAGESDGGYDVVLMNPPFERLKGVGPQDVAHVRRAYDLLKDGGRLVAIMGEGPFFRQSKPDKAFREWLDEVGAAVVKLPENAFKKSGTGVNARMVVVDKTNQASSRLDLDMTSTETADLREIELSLPSREAMRSEPGPRFSRRPQALTNDTVRQFARDVQERHGLETLDLFLTGRDDIKVNLIIVPRDQMKAGKGTAAMQEVTAFADRHGKRLILSPALPDDRKGTTSRGRLVRFYKRFGFVENKGRNKDFEISEGMYREPQESRFSRRSKGGPDLFSTDETDQGTQTVIPGAEKVSEREVAERGMEGRKKADKPQKGLDGLELFDPDSRGGNQGELFSRRARAVTQTPEFKRWFGNSKVVDESGEPLVVYHGTNADIESFDRSETVDGGFHLGTREQANMRVAGEGKNLIPAYASIKNPRRSKDMGGKWASKIKSAKSAGHDGIVYLNRYEGIPYEEFEAAREKGIDLDRISDSQFRRLIPSARDSYIAFEPAQIKSIFNRGTFDPTDDRISFERDSRRPTDPRSITPLAAEEFDAVVQRVTARWQSDIAVRPVASFDDLPASIQKSARDQGSDGSDIRGVYHNGTIYLVRDNIATAREAEEVLFHEGYGHAGLRMIAGGRLNSGLNRLYAAIGGEAGLNRMADARGIDLDAYREGLEGTAKEQRDAIMMDELLAHIAEQNRPGIKRAFKEVIGAVRQWLRTHGFPLLGRVSDSELVALLRRARIAVQAGEPGYREGFEDTPRFAAAWHGTPHDFEKFSTEAIGTGEGAQAYGYGLYFAGKKEVAEHYRGSVSQKPLQLVSSYINYAVRYGRPKGEGRTTRGWLEEQGLPTDREIVDLIDRAINGGEAGVGAAISYSNDAVSALSQLDTKMMKPGRLYRVNLAPAEDEYLYWDRPLSEQSEKVKAALERLAATNLKSNPLARAFETLQAFRNSVTLDYIKDGTKTGDVFYGALGRALGSEKAASQALADAGIPGIKYLDGSSRAKPLRDIKRAFLDAMPEDAEFDELTDLIGTGTFNDKQEAVLKALEADDWLGFDYPAQAISAALGGRLGDYDPSPALVKAVSDIQDEGTYNYVIFRDSDVEIEARFARRSRSDSDKRARAGLFGNSFATASEAVWDFMADKNKPLLARLALTGKAASDVARQKLQDRMLVTRRIQEAITAARGQAIPESQDTYLAEELYYGRTGKQLDDFRDKTVEPLVEAIAAEGLTLEQVDDYLYARHAPERNARIAEINEEMPDGGSGMTNAEAQEIMDRFDSAGLTPKLKKIAAMVDRISADTNRIRLDAGLVDEKTLKIWSGTYDNYVPLRGFAEVDIDNAEPVRPRTGKGFDIRGDESKRAMGRQSRADDILSNVLTMHEEAIVRAEKNRVGQTFMRMVQANPNDDVWEIAAVEYKPRFNRESGMVEYGPDPRYTLKENVLAVKVDGKVHHITIHHKALAKAMKNIGATSTNGLLRAMQRFNRWLAFINTSANPEFLVSNFARDIQTAGINLQEFNIKGLTRAVMRDVPKAIRGTFTGIRGDEASEWGRYYQEFAGEGGKTAFFALDDIRDQQKRINRILKDIEPGKLGKARQAAFATERLIQDVNAAVENGVRLSTYVNLRRHGVPVKKAASIVKNLTVNFNRKGEWAGTAQALYLFYNASLQGTVRMIHALRHRRVQQVVGGVVIASAMLEILNGLMSPEDDDGEKKYDKITPYTKTHNIIVVNPIPFGQAAWEAYKTGDWDNLAKMRDEFAGDDAKDVTAVKIPLPYGYNVFAVTGQKIGEVIRSSLGIGKKVDPLEAAADLMAVAVESFNPMGGEQDVLRTVVPTVLKPLYELEVNSNFMDIPIMPEDSPFSVPKPDSEKFFRSVSPASRWITQQLNEMTGGNAVRPGAVDVSPETLDHWVQFMTGATGAFVMRTGGTIYRALAGEGEDIRWNDIPFARRLVEGNSEYYTRHRYYEIRDAARLAEEEFKTLARAGDQVGSKRVRRDYKAELQASQAIKQVDKQLSELRKRRNAIEASKSLSDEAKKNRLERIEDKSRTLMSRIILLYNRAVRSAEGRPADDARSQAPEAQPKRAANQ